MHFHECHIFVVWLCDWVFTIALLALMFCALFSKKDPCFESDPDSKQGDVGSSLNLTCLSLLVSTLSPVFFSPLFSTSILSSSSSSLSSFSSLECWVLERSATLSLKGFCLVESFAVASSILGERSDSDSSSKRISCDNGQSYFSYSRSDLTQNINMPWLLLLLYIETVSFHMLVKVLFLELKN